MLTTFPPNDQRSRVPVNVFQFDPCHFASTQSQACQQQQDRVVTLAQRRMAVDGCQQPAHEIRWDRAGDRSHRPVGNRGNRPRQVMQDLSPIAQIMQE